jgi:hypothetical protein
MGLREIEGALHARFATLGYAYVAYPNGPKVEPPAYSMNFSLFTIYGDTLAAGLGHEALDRHQGIFQVTVRCPLNDSFGNPAGTYALNAALDAVRAAFAKGTSLGYPAAAPTHYVHCQVPTARHLGNLGDGWYTAVVRVPFTQDD